MKTWQMFVIALAILFFLLVTINRIETAFQEKIDNMTNNMTKKIDRLSSIIKELDNATKNNQLSFDVSEENDLVVFSEIISIEKQIRDIKEREKTRVETKWYDFNSFPLEITTNKMQSDTK